MLPAVVESQLLLDLATGDSFAEEVLFKLRLNALLPTSAPTATQEIFDMAVEDNNSAAILVATQFLSQNPDQTSVHAPELDGIRNGYAGLAADEMVQQGTVPNKNIGLIIAEAACLEARVVLFDDDLAKNLNGKGINAILENRHLPTVAIKGWLEFVR